MTAAATWGVRDLTVRFGKLAAVDGVSLDVPAGAVTAVCGGDGAGKSTLLRALAGGVQPAGGHVRRPNRERIGYVAGAGGPYPDLTVDENMSFVASAYGLRGADFEARARDLLASIGLEEARQRLAGRLSGGMRRKLAFALAMLHQPDLLVLDEPTTGVDPVSRTDLWRLVAGAAASGAAVVVSTSSRDEAERAASVLLLEAGRGTLSTTASATTSANMRPSFGAGRSAPPPSAQHLAAANSVTRRFGDFVAVDAVDLAIDRGEVVGLLGANGAGKTTLIRMLLGLLPPSEGRVELFGRAPSRATRRRLGYVPQALGLWEDLSVAENLQFVAQSFAVPAATPEPELAALSGTLVRDLPLGLRRRLSFAAALAHEPELLVLDEPTSGVDTSARDQLWETVRAAADNGAGVLVTTHHMEEADACDRLVIMAGGRIAAHGTMASIIGRHSAVAVTAPSWETAFAALTDAGLAVALLGRTLRVPDVSEERVRSILDACGLAASLRVVPATLEEAFVSLTRGRQIGVGMPKREALHHDAV